MKKKWATGQSCIRKEITSYRIGILVWKWQGAGKFYIFSWIALDIAWLVTSCKLLRCIKKVGQTFFWIKASGIKIVFLISIAASYLFPRWKSFDRQVTKQIAVLKTSLFSYKKYFFNHLHCKLYLLLHGLQKIVWASSQNIICSLIPKDIQKREMF